MPTITLTAAELRILMAEFVSTTNPRENRRMLETIIEHKAWGLEGYKTFTDWWLDQVGKYHVIKELAYTAAAQMIEEDREADARTIHGVGKHTITELKLLKFMQIPAWTLAYNAPRAVTSGQRRLVIEAIDDQMLTDYKFSCSRLGVDHREFALEMLVAATVAEAAGASASDILAGIAGSAPVAVAAGKP